jgi:hypothetical protein
MNTFFSKLVYFTEQNGIEVPSNGLG